jgi:hypothetical protein
MVVIVARCSKVSIASLFCFTRSRTLIVLVSRFSIFLIARAHALHKSFVDPELQRILLAQVRPYLSISSFLVFYNKI